MSEEQGVINEVVNLDSMDVHQLFSTSIAVLDWQGLQEALLVSRSGECRRRRGKEREQRRLA